MADKRNLLEETVERLSMYGYGPEDVLGFSVGVMTFGWDIFSDSANREYDSGWGHAEVNIGLVCYLSDGSRMDRQEYDGREGWRFIPTFEFNPDDPNALTDPEMVDGILFPEW